jgi:glycosyltransferase involved in cell wall biosynthesis
MNITKVSVIIPVYNVEAYLRQCLNSIVGQTLREIEIICVDDGSTDGSAAILKEYAQKDGRIKVITQENAGAGAARNVGLDSATGQYLYFCDPDDWCRTKMLSKLVEAADRDKSDIVICGRTIYDAETGRKLGSVGFPDKVWMLPECFCVSKIADIAFSVTRGTVWDKLFRRDLVDSLNLRFQNLRRNNDLYFVNVAVAHAKKMSVVRSPLYCHRVNRRGSLQKNIAGAEQTVSLAWNAIEMRLKKDDCWKLFSLSCENCRRHDAGHQGYTSSDGLKMRLLSWIPFGVKGLIKRIRYKISKSALLFGRAVRCVRGFARCIAPYALQNRYRSRKYGEGGFCRAKNSSGIMDYAMNRFHKVLPAFIVTSYLIRRNKKKKYSALTINEVKANDPGLFAAVRHSLTRHSNVSFSVILPTYNRIRFIGRAIESILNQTAENVELVVVDDGSTDGTENFIRSKYSAEIKAGKIVYVKQQNQGVCRARNIGLSIARGEWIVYLDSDNLLMPYALDVYARAIEENPGQKTFYAKLELMSTGVECGRSFSFRDLVDHSYIDLGVFVHHSSLVAELGGFDENLKRLVDWELIARFAHVYRPFYLPLKTMCYNDLNGYGRISNKEDFISNYKCVREKLQQYA